MKFKVQHTTVWPSEGKAKPSITMFPSVQPWSDTEALHYSRTAQSLFLHSYDHKKPDPDNCGACALVAGEQDGPNYAGWARVYVEASRTIPAKWTEALKRERASSNRLYAEALERSIKTFGLMIA